MYRPTYFYVMRSGTYNCRTLKVEIPRQESGGLKIHCSVPLRDINALKMQKLLRRISRKVQVNNSESINDIYIIVPRWSSS